MKTSKTKSTNYKLHEGSVIPKISDVFSRKENAFIYWYTHPGSKAFMNTKHAALNAGYTSDSATVQGNFLKKSQ